MYKNIGKLNEKELGFFFCPLVEKNKSAKIKMRAHLFRLKNLDSNKYLRDIG